MESRNAVWEVKETRERLYFDVRDSPDPTRKDVRHRQHDRYLDRYRASPPDQPSTPEAARHRTPHATPRQIALPPMPQNLPRPSHSRAPSREREPRPRTRTTGHAQHVAGSYQSPPPQQLVAQQPRAGHRSSRQHGPEARSSSVEPSHEPHRHRRADKLARSPSMQPNSHQQVEYQPQAPQAMAYSRQQHPQSPGHPQRSPMQLQPQAQPAVYPVAYPQAYPQQAICPQQAHPQQAAHSQQVAYQVTYPQQFAYSQQFAYPYPAVAPPQHQNWQQFPAVPQPTGGQPAHQHRSPRKDRHDRAHSYADSPQVQATPPAAPRRKRGRSRSRVDIPSVVPPRPAVSLTRIERVVSRIYSLGLGKAREKHQSPSPEPVKRTRKRRDHRD